jgi:hypothetical protein
MFGTALLAVVTLALVFAFILMRVEKLTLFAPKASGGLWTSAASYCTDQCRTRDGRCPMTGTEEQAPRCPLWGFVAADLPTKVYGNPFAHLRGPGRAAA